MHQSFLLLASFVCVAHEAVAGPFVSASMGVSSVGYRGRTVLGQFEGENTPANLGKQGTYSMAGLMIGNQFSLGRAFVSPYGEVKAVLGDESFGFRYDRQDYSLYKSRSILGVGAQIGYTLTHFSPYLRLGVRRQNVEIYTTRTVAGPGHNIDLLYRKKMAVNGWSWGLGADIPVGNQLCVNVAFSTTYQVEKQQAMDYADDPNNKPANAADVKTAPYRRNVMDFTIGVRYDF
jgi:opacity protein-like surface antigen